MFRAYPVLFALVLSLVACAGTPPTSRESRREVTASSAPVPIVPTPTSATTEVALLPTVPVPTSTSTSLPGRAPTATASFAPTPTIPPMATATLTVIPTAVPTLLPTIRPTVVTMPKSQPTSTPKVEVQGPPGIPGLNMDDVVRTASERFGLACGEPVTAGTLMGWMCIGTKDGTNLSLQTTGLSPSHVFFVEATGGDDLLLFVASLQYDGARPELARDWYMANVESNDAETVIGGMHFKLYGSADERRLYLGAP